DSNLLLGNTSQEKDYSMQLHRKPEKYSFVNHLSPAESILHDKALEAKLRKVLDAHAYLPFQKADSSHQTKLVFPGDNLASAGFGLFAIRPKTLVEILPTAHQPCLCLQEKAIVFLF